MIGNKVKLVVTTVVACNVGKHFMTLVIGFKAINSLINYTWALECTEGVVFTMDR